MHSGTLYAMDVTYEQLENGRYEGNFTMTYDNDQVIELVNDINNAEREFTIYNELTILTPLVKIKIWNVSFEAYSDFSDYRTGANHVTFKFRCNRLLT